MHTTNPSRTRASGRSALRCLSAVAIIAGGIGIMAGSAAAGGAAPSEGCGAAWSLVGLTDLAGAIRAANPELNGVRDAATFQDGDDTYTFDQWVEHIYAPADRNGDGWFCLRTTKGSQGTDKSYVPPEWLHLLAGRHYTITNFNDNNSRPL